MMMVKNQKEGFGRVCLLGERVAGASLGPWWLRISCLGSMYPGSPDSYGGRILRQAGAGAVLIKKRKTLRMPKGLGAVHSSHPRAGSGSIGDAAAKMQRCTFASFYRTKTSLSRGASWS